MYAHVLKTFSRQFVVACSCKKMAAPLVFVEVSDDVLVKFPVKHYYPYNKKNITRWLQDMNFIFSF
jgi:hypothetical protein